MKRDKERLVRMGYAVQDGLTFLSGLTFSRAWNLGMVGYSYYLSRISKTPILPALPVALSVEPTTSCNLRCPECPSGLRAFTRPTGMLQPKLFQRVIDELAPTLSYLTFYFQGEPYLNPQFLDMVRYASAKNIYTATSTNAHYLDEENAKKTIASGLHRLIISIDGVDQETYASYRVGGRLSKVIEGTRNVMKWKRKLKSRTPHVLFQFLVVRPNEGQIGEVRALANSLGVDEVKFKTAQIYDYQYGSDLIPLNDAYSRYKKLSDGTYRIKNRQFNHCWKMWHSCVITWDGKIVPCCFDKNAHFVMGDLEKNTFKEIWQNAKYQTFRSMLLRSRGEISMCKNCTEGTKTWL